MLPEAKKSLFDIREAADAISEFTRGKTLADFEADLALRSAVQWQFAVVGEAMTRLRRDHLDVAQRIGEYERIIKFRNQLIHGYDVIRSGVTWQIVEEKLPILRAEVEAMLAEPEDQPEAASSKPST